MARGTDDLIFVGIAITVLIYEFFKWFLPPPVEVM